MSLDYKAGTYIDYPCLKCGAKMNVKDNLKKLSPLEEGLIECRDCGVEKRYKGFELKAMVDAKK